MNSDVIEKNNKNGKFLFNSLLSIACCRFLHIKI